MGNAFILEQKPADLLSVAERLRNPSITFAGNSPPTVFGCVVALTEPEREALLSLIETRGSDG